MLSIARSSAGRARACAKSNRHLMNYSRPSFFLGWFVRGEEAVKAVAGSMCVSASVRQFPATVRPGLPFGRSPVSRGTCSLTLMTVW